MVVDPFLVWDTSPLEHQIWSELFLSPVWQKSRWNRFLKQILMEGRTSGVFHSPALRNMHSLIKSRVCISHSIYFFEIYTPTEHWGWIFPQSAGKCTPNKNSANSRKLSRPALSLLQLCKRSSSPEVSSAPYRVPHHLTRTHHWIKVNGLINCFDC